jgi:hypothetical protein
LNPRGLALRAQKCFERTLPWFFDLLLVWQPIGIPPLSIVDFPVASSSNDLHA